MSKDYYETLGVSKSATDDEIKKAYRTLAREWHPDVAKDKPNAEAKFKEINEAYQVLGDKQKRSQYDQFGQSGFGGYGNQGAGSDGGGFNPFSGFDFNQSGPFTWSYSSSANQQQSDFDFNDPFDIFEQVFGFRGFGNRQRRGRSVSYSLTITLADAIKGYDEIIEIDGKKLKVKLPKGVVDGTRVKFEGKGESPNKDIPPGDLYIIINIKPDPDFAIQGTDVFSIKEIPMSLAVLGGSIPIKVVDPDSNSGFSEKKLKIPTGTQPGTQLRLKNMGMPSPKGYGKGNHYITIKVNIPTKLSKSQKEAIENNF